MATTKAGLFKSKIKNLKITNIESVVDGEFVIKIIAALDGIYDFEITNRLDSSYYYTSTAGLLEDYMDAIPGVNFNFDEASGLEIGDSLEIITTGRTLGSVPSENSVYYVSYKYRKSSEDYLPKIFFEYDDVVSDYGNYNVTASGIVINSLSLGAEIAFLNGVGRIICVQAKNDSDYEMKAAIDLLKRELPGVVNVNTVVPLSDSISVGTHMAEHVELMSSYEYGKERMCYLAASANQPITKNATALNRTIGMVETAKSFSNERVVYVVPGSIIRDVRDLRTGRIVERVLPGCYSAVAVASLGLIYDPAEPLTNKKISGFTRLGSMFVEQEKNFLAEAGCCVLHQIGNNIKVRHGITTSTATVNETEITLVQIKDYVIEACRSVTAELYIGNKLRPAIVGDVQYTIASILSQFISQEIIIQYGNLQVKRSKEDPRQIDVRFEIEAVYPLNYIQINFGFMAVS